MRSIAILNPAAGRGGASRVWNKVAAGGACDVITTSGPGDATRITREALRSGVERIFVIGGDGTFNEVLNGCFADGVSLNPEAVLVPVAAGTGCDLARAVESITATRPGPITMDVGKATCAGEHGKTVTRYFAGVASCGQSARVIENLRRPGLAAACGGRIAYLAAILRTLPGYRPESFELRIDEREDRQISARCIAIANTRTFGGGLVIAPRARPDDGRLDVAVVGDVSALRLLRHARAIWRGVHDGLNFISHAAGTRIVIRGCQTVGVEVDGEVVGRLPAVFEVVPQAVRLSLPACT